MKKKLIIGFGIVLLLILWAVISVYPDWLWFGKLGFAPVFWTMIISRFGFGLLIWFILMLILAANFYVTRRFIFRSKSDTAIQQEGLDLSQFGVSGRMLNTLLLALILIASFVIASKGSSNWDMVLRYLYQEPFGHADPIFSLDVGFYVFTLPMYLLIRYGLLVFFVFAGLIAIAWYLKDGALQVLEEFGQTEERPVSIPKIAIAPKAKQHLLFLAGIIVLLVAWGFQLKIYGLLYSTQGPAFGASFTDVHAKILAYRILIIFTLGFAFMLFYNALKPKTKLILISGAIWLGAVLVLGTALPQIFQKFIVKPNELARESPYIAHNIEHTRNAYNLNKIKEVDFSVSTELTANDIKEENVTIQNIRIWDERPLLQTYRQIQAIRLYYDFNNVDVDRYKINDQYRQIMLAARELVVKQLPAQARTWVNTHLTYTHGYGVACSPVNEVTQEGLPRLFIKDLPPSFEIDLSIERPEIYFGERTDDYVLVRTKTKEFDYPKGDKNVYTIYQGRGGVPIGSFLRRVLFAIEFMDPQIFFTTYLGPESRIMYNRRIEKRARLIAPFLDYDGDPYMVVSGGRLYWVLDAYTTSDMYPYSLRSYGRFKKNAVNYIRNSVKVTIDAYNGDVVFYHIDEKDPIVRTYAKIFPKLFRPFSEMPADLKKHVRYPKDLFHLQAATYTTYHMVESRVFYNQEDRWELPDELYGDRRQKMDPYYIIIKLPEGEKEEYLLMLPFTPSEKDNMIGWLAARSDLPHYGNLLVYKLPKEKLVYGPMQIEARVDQQTEISRELSLWGQRGSRVIRGNLLVIPVKDSFIYVEPIYLEAKQEEDPGSQAAPSQSERSTGQRRKQAPGFKKPATTRSAALPELKRVIVAYGNRVTMGENLDKALNQIFGESVPMKETIASAGPGTSDFRELGASALKHYFRAKVYLQQGDWAGYGRELDHVERLLKEMGEVTVKSKD